MLNREATARMKVYKLFDIENLTVKKRQGFALLDSFVELCAGDDFVHACTGWE